MEFLSRRSPVLGLGGMVATSQPLATAAGLKILRMGGNAADAAVAAAAALNVTEPTSTGIGGDCFALFYQASAKKTFALNGSGRSPAALTLQLVRRVGYEEELPPFHPHTITVPGAAAGWHDLVARFGQLSLEQVLTPAIDMAEGGFPVSPVTAYFWDRGARLQLASAPNGLELTIDGRAPRSGEIFKNPGLARTFRLLAEHGQQAFYQGEIAAAIIELIQSQGGVMTLDDLASHHSDWVEPISTTYRGYRVWECPPNGQGLAALMALNFFEALDHQPGDLVGVDDLHLMIECMRLAFADTRWYVTDPEHAAIPVKDLLSKTYARQRVGLIESSRATLDFIQGSPTSSSDTVYLSAVDRHGNACSFINSNYMGFGTGFVPKGFGFSLQNRGHGFDLQPGHPNVLAPQKRPYHTIIPSMITHADSDDLFACFGVMGGFMQPQGHFQVAVNLIDRKSDPQTALDLPRFCIADGRAGGAVSIEAGFDFDLIARLAHLGHPVIPVADHNRAIFGRGQIILRDRENGVLWGGSDPRADGLAMTLP
jgi:gamma-glutamyltranspeptidase/glutathione hydrolase